MSSSIHANTVQPVFTSHSKRIEADEIAADVAAFKKAGGKIQVLSTHRAPTVIDKRVKNRAARTLQFGAHKPLKPIEAT